MTKVKRLAMELIPYTAGCAWCVATLEERVRAEDTALHVLARERAAVRRARGKRLGFTSGETLVYCGPAIIGSPLECRIYRNQGDVPSETVVDLRVVAVPKRKKGGRK